MRIKLVLFDLDGTLLPMDMDRFMELYFGLMAKKLAPHGYDPKKLVGAIWAGTKAMVQNDGNDTNEAVFWNCFCAVFGPEAMADEPVFHDYYLHEFQQVRSACGFDPEAAKAVRAIQNMGIRVALATNPLFPAIATENRIRWAGLSPEDFEIITTYENSRHCKPNPDYYRDLLEALQVRPEECLMVGNDVTEDMMAKDLGMRVFLIPACLINKENKDISQYPQGTFPELLDYIRKEMDT